MADFLTTTFLRIKARLENRARWILHDPDRVDDALQEAFVRLWGRYSIHNEKEAEALLMRTVRNVSIDENRKRRAESLPAELPAEEEVSSWERERLFLELEEHIAKELSDTQQYIIRRHEYEGVSLEQVAKELGMQAPAVRMQLSRARKIIKAKYEDGKE